MAVAIDVGEWNDIHPLHKQPVGERLARLALKDVYGNKKSSRTAPCRWGLKRIKPGGN